MSDLESGQTVQVLANARISRIHRNGTVTLEFLDNPGTFITLLQDRVVRVLAERPGKEEKL